MAAITYEISFTPSLGNLGTLIEYKETADSSWTTPSSPSNPTSLSSYTLDLDDELTYIVRLSTVGYNCSPIYSYFYLGPTELSYLGGEAFDCGDTLVEDATFFIQIGNTPLMGTILYTDNTFTTPYTDYEFIQNPDTGVTYQIDTDTGEVIDILPCTGTTTTTTTAAP